MMSKEEEYKKKLEELDKWYKEENQLIEDEGTKAWKEFLAQEKLFKDEKDKAWTEFYVEEQSFKDEKNKVWKEFWEKEELFKDEKDKAWKEFWEKEKLFKNNISDINKAKEDRIKKQDLSDEKINKAKEDRIKKQDLSDEKINKAKEDYEKQKEVLQKKKSEVSASYWEQKNKINEILDQLSSSTGAASIFSTPFKPDPGVGTSLFSSPPKPDEIPSPSSISSPSFNDVLNKHLATSDEKYKSATSTAASTTTTSNSTAKSATASSFSPPTSPSYISIQPDPKDKEIADLKTKIAELKQQNNNLTTTSTIKESELKKTLEAKNTEVKKLQDELSKKPLAPVVDKSKEQEITKLKSENQTLSSENGRLKSIEVQLNTSKNSLATKESEIATLKTQLDEANKKAAKAPVVAPVIDTSAKDTDIKQLKEELLKSKDAAIRNSTFAKQKAEEAEKLKKELEEAKKAAPVKIDDKLQKELKEKDEEIKKLKAKNNELVEEVLTISLSTTPLESLKEKDKEIAELKEKLSQTDVELYFSKNRPVNTSAKDAEIEDLKKQLDEARKVKPPVADSAKDKKIAELEKQLKDAKKPDPSKKPDPKDLEAKKLELEKAKKEIEELNKKLTEKPADGKSVPVVNIGGKILTEILSEKDIKIVSKAIAKPVFSILNMKTKDTVKIIELVKSNENVKFTEDQINILDNCIKQFDKKNIKNWKESTGEKIKAGASIGVGVGFTAFLATIAFESNNPNLFAEIGKKSVAFKPITDGIASIANLCKENPLILFAVGLIVYASLGYLSHTASNNIKAIESQNVKSCAKEITVNVYKEVNGFDIPQR